jgi:hypothetical protein
MKKQTRPLLLYIGATTLGTFIVTALLIFVCTKLNFDSKSAICVYLYGIGGYIVKTSIFTLTYLLLFKKSFLTSKAIRTSMAWTPFILFFLWYLTLIVFQVESLYFDLSFGYIVQFPHFYFQLFTVLLMCILTTVRLNRRYRQEIQTIG